MAPTPCEIEAVVRSCRVSRDVAVDLLNRPGYSVEKIKRRWPRIAGSYLSESSTDNLGGPSLQYPALFERPAETKTSCSEDAIYPDWPSFEDVDTTLNSTSVMAELPASPGPSTASWDSTQGQVDNGTQITVRANSDADEVEWDFVLPASQVVDYYLNMYRHGTLPQQINLTIAGIPSIFFAVATNNEAILRLWVAHGGDVCAVHEPSGVPLVAFAIANAGSVDADTTPMLATLLSLGASPHAIPPEFYMDCLADLPEAGPQPQSAAPGVGPTRPWCTGRVRARLGQAMNLTHRYQLWKAASIQRLYQRQKQVAVIKNAEPLLGLAYFLVGQTLASSLLLQKLLTNLANPSRNRRKPLVLTFAGPSGHGKTELARRMGHLLSLELEIVDCTVVSQEMELFGPRPGYAGSETGSPLNNFLSRNSGRRSIVFFDEFEKTTQSVHQALLLPFDNGESEDRRSRVKVDCSQTIFILATNALDNEIVNFCDHNKDIFGEHGQQQLKAAKDLSKLLRQGFLQRFGAPLTGRISDFIPFLPFRPTEQAVVAHKFLLEMVAQLQRPVRLAQGPDQQLLGDTRLRIRRDGTVCSSIAANSYHPALGARSLKTAVEQVLDNVTTTYLRTDAEIKEGAGIQNYVMDVIGDEVVVERVVEE